MESVPDRPAATPIGVTTLVGALAPALAGQVAETLWACRSAVDRLCWLASGPLWTAFPY